MKKIMNILGISAAMLLVSLPVKIGLICLPNQKRIVLLFLKQ